MQIERDLGRGKENKTEIASKIGLAIAEATGKPISYVAVLIDDNKALSWGGPEGGAPAALGVMNSLGAISKESNGKITAAVTEALAPYGVA